VYPQDGPFSEKFVNFLRNEEFDIYQIPSMETKVLKNLNFSMTFYLRNRFLVDLVDQLPGL
jgi:hypothetical protein